MDSPVSADWSSIARSPSTVPSTDATSPCRISRRSPGAMSSSGTSSNAPPRYRVAVRGTRDRRSLISRRARPSAKLSRKVPPEYITATTAAARVSPNSRAAAMDSAATMSSPTSPFERLRTISTSRAASTGRTPADQATAACSGKPAALSARPATSPSAAMAKRAVFRRSRSKTFNFHTKTRSKPRSRNDRAGHRSRRVRSPAAVAGKRPRDLCLHRRFPGGGDATLHCGGLRFRLVRADAAAKPSPCLGDDAIWSPKAGPTP